MKVGEMYYSTEIGFSNIKKSYIFLCGVNEDHFDCLGYYGEGRIWYWQFNKNYKLLTDIFVEEE